MAQEDANRERVFNNGGLKPVDFSWADLWNENHNQEQYVDNVFYEPEPVQVVEPEPEPTPEPATQSAPPAETVEPTTVTEPTTTQTETTGTGQKQPAPEPVEPPKFNVAEPTDNVFSRRVEANRADDETEFYKGPRLFGFDSLGDFADAAMNIGAQPASAESTTPATNPLTAPDMSNYLSGWQRREQSMRNATARNTAMERANELVPYDYGGVVPADTNASLAYDNPVRRTGEYRAEAQAPEYDGLNINLRRYMENPAEGWQADYDFYFNQAVNLGMSEVDARAAAVEAANRDRERAEEQMIRETSYRVLNADPLVNNVLQETGVNPMDEYKTLSPFVDKIKGFASDLAQDFSNYEGPTLNAFNQMVNDRVTANNFENYDPRKTENPGVNGYREWQENNGYPSQTDWNGYHFRNDRQAYLEGWQRREESMRNAMENATDRAMREQVRNDSFHNPINPSGAVLAPESDFANDSTASTRERGFRAPNNGAELRPEDEFTTERIRENLVRGNPVNPAGADLNPDNVFQPNIWDWDTDRVRRIYENLPAHLTPEQKYDYIRSLYDATVKEPGKYDESGIWHDPVYNNDSGVFHFDPSGAHGNYLPEDIAIPTYDNGHANEAMIWALEHKTETDEDGNQREVFSHTPHEILTLFVNTSLDGDDYTQTAWRGLNNVPEEVRNRLLVDLVHGGDPDFGRIGNDHKLERFQGTLEEYEKLCQEFINSMPALQELIRAGVMTESDIANFFFKAPPKTTKGSSGGYGGGGRYYGGAGGYIGGGGYKPSVNLPTPSTAKQQQNRIYNIMKNWSF